MKSIYNTSWNSRKLKTTEGDMVDEIGFIVYNKEIALKVNNAIKHLLELSLKNYNFKEKDPFGN